MYDINVLASGLTLTRQEVVNCVTNYALVRGVTPYSCLVSVWVSEETLTLPGCCKPRISLFMVHVTNAGPSLGVFDASRAMFQLLLLSPVQ